MKGQTMEMMGFLILSVTIIVVILFMRTYLAGTYGRSFSSLVQRQEVEGFRAGAISVLQTTEDRTGKTLLELLGIAAYQGTGNLNFGPGRGQVDVIDEITWRMNEIYGRNKWYIKIPFPDVIPRYQMIMIIDTSASLCDDFNNIKQNLPAIIERLRNDGYNVFVTIFTLYGGQDCCGGGSLDCSGLFGEERRDRTTMSYIHCFDLTDRSCQQNSPINNEDWGRGLACAIEHGPYENWYDFTAKIGIVLSDELSTGSSDNHEITDENNNSLDLGIQYAKGINMKVFPFKAKNTQPDCPVCAVSHGPEGDKEVIVYCHGCCLNDDNLRSQMEYLAYQTGGELYELTSSDQASDAIESIFRDHVFPVKPYLEIGTTPPDNKNLNTEVVSVPVPFVGGYTNIYITTWS